MNSFLKFFYNIRYFFIGGIAGCIPFMLLHIFDIAKSQNNFIFYWGGICIIGYILSILGKNINDVE